MIVGTVREIKNHEYRVGLTPDGVKQLTARGHTALVESSAGVSAGFDDESYIAAGAQIVERSSEIFERAELVVKVKEPQPEECRQLRPQQVLFTYLHLAPDLEQTNLLRESGCTAIAYETVTDPSGHLPLLAPMSEVAGRMAIQAGAHSLERPAGGSGVLLGGVPGTPPGKVLIIGGGTSGTHALEMAVGLGADVTLVDTSLQRLREIAPYWGNRVKTIYATPHVTEELAIESDLVIGAVLVPGASSPTVLSRDAIRNMRRGSVLVDISIDQGGCFETSRPTTHTEPTFVQDDVVHYCVTNIPGAVPRTSTIALTNATTPFLLELADKDVRTALSENRHLRAGLNIHAGQITHEGVAASQNETYVTAEEALAQ